MSCAGSAHPHELAVTGVDAGERDNCELRLVAEPREEDEREGGEQRAHGR